MVKLRPFQAYLANKKLAKSILSHEYDVISSKEARPIAKSNSLSFLRVNKPEVDLPLEAEQKAVY